MKRSSFASLALLLLFPLASLTSCGSSSSSGATSSASSSMNTTSSASSEPSSSSFSSSTTSSEESSSSSSSVVVLHDYTLTFDTNGGSEVLALIATEGTSITAPEAPTKPGYTFAGWYSDIGLTVSYVFGVMPSQDLTLYAKWSINQYTISFDTNGGSPISDITQDYGTDIVLAETPIKTGYTFMGWYRDPEFTLSFESTTMGPENITLYAMWSINQYTVSFDTNGGSAITDIVQDYGTSVSEPEPPTKPGYTFAGWFIDPELTQSYVFETIPDYNVTVYAAWEIDPAYGTISIAEFKAVPTADTNYHEVLGVTILCNDGMGLLVIADETGVIVALNPSLIIQKGDLVKVGGYRADMNGVAVMANGDLSVDMTVYDHGYTIPYPPLALTASEYAALDAEVSGNWAIYAALSGTLSIDSETHLPVLTQGTDSISFYPMTEEDYEALQVYVGMDIAVNGMILPNFDTETPYLMFIYDGDLAPFGYSDTTLLNALEQVFRDNFEAASYYPGQIIDLPNEYPIILASISYETTGENASLFDLVTMTFAGTIEEPVDIGLNVTVTLLSGASQTFEIQLHVAPIATITIAELKTKTDFDTETGIGDIYGIRGVVLHIQASDGFNLALVVDATGVAYINTTDETVAVGDEVIALGYKMTMGAMTLLFNDPSSTVVQIVAHGQSLPLSATAISVSDFVALSLDDPNLYLSYYVLSGTLSLLNTGDPDNVIYGLGDGTNTAYIYPADTAARDALANYIGASVTIYGFAMIAGDPGSQMLLLAFFVYPDAIIVNTL